MTDQNSPSAAENVSRGTLFALAAIPIGIAVATFGGLVVGPFAALVAVVVGALVVGLYSRGAGVPLKTSRAPVMVIAIIAIVLTAFAGAFAGRYFTFADVGGDGGPLGSQFLTIFAGQLQRQPLDTLAPILIGIVLGIVFLISAIRGPRAARSNRIPAPAVRVPPVQAPPAQVPPAAPRANTPSPGILLNGKPIDPDKK